MSLKHESERWRHLIEERDFGDSVRIVHDKLATDFPRDLFTSFKKIFQMESVERLIAFRSTCIWLAAADDKNLRIHWTSCDEKLSEKLF